jgi:hypothetical protein
MFPFIVMKKYLQVSTPITIKRFFAKKMNQSLLWLLFARMEVISFPQAILQNRQQHHHLKKNIFFSPTIGFSFLGLKRSFLDLSLSLTCPIFILSHLSLLIFPFNGFL